jgi:hypothetical protein
MVDDNPVRNFLRNPFVPLAAAIAFALVAWHEWQYRDAHPHAYGPAVQIVIGAVAGVVIGLAASAIGFQDHIRDERSSQLALELYRLRDRVERLEAGGDSAD